ncbi:hypothetical protein BZA77DRAFT_352135 [Pyronema omphalodes]|nr:hypothetical protein BZA77DRAFT_359375 [Pyronema omphalodes]KAI5817951.1 hypothetical protein BZA77DRAFT_352135 [Pyronema omphalodes]
MNRNVGYLNPIILHDKIHLHKASTSTFEMGKKSKKNVASTVTGPEANTQQKGVQKTIQLPEHLATHSDVATPTAKKESGKSVPEPLGSEGEDKSPKRKKQKTKTENTQTLSSALATTLLGCPTDVLNSIIGFLRGPDASTCNRDLLNLRLVNRGFRYLLQTVVYESVQIPRKHSDNPSVTDDVRELLRLIDLNPSLAASIKHLTYNESHPDDIIPVQCSLKELKTDHKIFSKLVDEVDLKTLTGKTFYYPLNPSGLREMSKLYEQMCSPLLLSRLTNLGMLIFDGYVGGRYACLLTRWASHIWTRMPLRSLETLLWQSKEEEHKDYQWMQWPTYDVYHESSTTPEKQPSNEWNLISFLRFTPALEDVTFIGDRFLARSTPQNMPILNSLTSICIQTEYFKETSQLLYELLKCSPLLKSLETCHFDDFKASRMREALHIVRNTIEEIDIIGPFEGTSSTDGGIGPFLNFPELRTITTDLASLVPLSPADRPEDTCLLKLLPANLESLHLYLYDPLDLPSSSRPSKKDGQRHSNSLLKFIRRPYEWLEHVALAKESGALRNLRSISIEDECWKLSSSKITDGGPEKLGAICARLGIEWEWSSGDVKGRGKTKSYSDVEADSDSDSDWETDWAMRYETHFET